MKELDDFLEHSGVKGMKWGVVRWRLKVADKQVNRLVKSRKMSKSAGDKIKADAYHDYKNPRSLYGMAYRSKIKKGDDHYQAIKFARKQAKLAKMGVAINVAIPLTIAGAKILTKAYNVKLDPNLINMGREVFG